MSKYELTSKKEPLKFLHPRIRTSAPFSLEKQPCINDTRNEGHSKQAR